MKIKDKITLGTVAGMIATIPQLFLHEIFVFTGYIKYHSLQLTGSVFLLKKLSDDPLGLFIGFVVWETIAAILGVATVYILILTGKDNWWLKGLIFTIALAFISVYGFAYTLGGAKIVPFDIKTNFVVLLGSILFGLLMPYLIIKLGDIDSKL